MRARFRLIFCLMHGDAEATASWFRRSSVSHVHDRGLLGSLHLRMACDSIGLGALGMVITDESRKLDIGIESY